MDFGPNVNKLPSAGQGRYYFDCHHFIYIFIFPVGTNQKLGSQSLHSPSVLQGQGDLNTHSSGPIEPSPDGYRNLCLADWGICKGS